MRLVYCIHSTYNPGGMERVLLNKVRYLVGKGGYEISIVTTDQKGRPSFFPFPSEVKMTDLGINYTDDKFKDLSGTELDNAVKNEINAKESSLVGNMNSQGTTPRRYTDLLASLCDLTSGSGDKGTPVVLVQNYFNNYSE